MAYINIPSLNYTDLCFCIVLKPKNELNQEEIYISHSLNHYLSNIKKKINKFNNYWDYYKKITNPYEFIHTQVPNIKLSISKYKPLSRSFFKMIEIINTFSFLNEKNCIKSFHLAEGPGGFIEAFNYKRNNKNDTYYGMTLISDDINIPSWKKSSNFINNNKNIIIEYGSSKTGDLFLKENLLYCKNNYGNSMDYITGDGGFDFSIDFNKQEDLSMKLILSQIFFAIIMQKIGGNFVLKIFDIFKFKTVEIIFLLSNLYDYVYIYKPYTSRIANSEKYIICKNFKNINKNINENIINNFDYILNNIDSIYSIFNISFPKLFLKKLEEINAIYGQQQIENINITINLIREFINVKYNNNNINSDNYYLSNDSSQTKININNDLSNIIVKNNTSPKSYISDDIFKLDIKDIDIDIDIDIDNYNDNDNDNDNENDNDNDNDNDDDDNNDNNDNDKQLDIKCIIKNNILSSNSNNKLSPIQNDLINNYEKTSNTQILSDLEKFESKINTIKNINIQKSINWCNKYNFPINKYFLGLSNT